MSDIPTRAADQPGRQALTAERRREIEAFPNPVQLGRMQCGELADVAVTATRAIRELLDALDAATRVVDAARRYLPDAYEANWRHADDAEIRGYLFPAVWADLVVAFKAYDAATPPVPSGEGVGDE